MSASDDAEPPAFSRDAPAPGRVEAVSPLIRRLVCPNGGPFTQTGTCTYIVGHGRVAVVDPGPEEPSHVEALLAALGDETVAAIAVTHTHRDHSPAARALKAATGAPIVGCGPHRAARAVRGGERTILDAAADRDHGPDVALADGERIDGPGWTLVAVATPGHTMNHLAFALPEDEALLSGDHVMGWSTSIVAPPDGAMGAYMASLDRLRGRPERTYWPGHGGPVREPQRFVRALAHHRRAREAAILDRLGAGGRTIPALVAEIYQGLDPRLAGAAALSVYAHLEDLVARGQAATDGDPALDGTYRPA
ncbi:beta-lactamase domain protein [Methylobacterium sp. 4-46]|uniref:MBL fold metallo-hydrolase n=1 Tax=unclassified Methylobacterium TaxID=2615210 RepID=UPI000165C79F|nr:MULTISPECIES: MBL fold metallo-hydrolase [Methylobacterium]ACA17170.1 beta-lactamase domain protein [Methylobacterium sp. 4-46]WFT82854.1 MBL fold metallo-hydrolase [Methylobacterium nodulans]